MRITASFLVYGASLARLALAAWLCIAILHSALLALVALSCVILADIGDGHLARRLSLDSAWRRFVDTGVDRITIHAAFLTALARHPELSGWYLPLLLRDVVAIASSIYGISRWRFFLVGDRWHRVASLTAAVQGVAFLFPNPAALLITSLISLTANWCLLATHGVAFVQAVLRAPATPHRGLRRIDSRAGDGLRILVRLRTRSQQTLRPTSVA